jgi:methionyl-tRNA formyltransferase
MKVLFLTNNSITSPLAEWLQCHAKEDIILYSDKITVSHLETFGPDIIISYNYRYLITEDVINLSNNKILNLHISLLPWNRGADPNLWSFIENTPKGVTIHLIDKGIDTGDILLQKELKFDERRATLRSSYHTLHREIQELFIANWDKISKFQTLSAPQQKKGSFHYSKDSMKIKNIFGSKIWHEPIYKLKQKLEKMALI